MVYPSAAEPSPGTDAYKPLTNGYNGYHHTSSSEQASDQEDVVISDVESETSDSFHVGASHNAAMPENSHGGSPATGNSSYDDSDLESQRRRGLDNRSPTSSSPDSSHGVKRKSAVDETDY